MSRLNESRTIAQPPSLSNQAVDRGDLSLKRGDQAEGAARSDDAGHRALPSKLTDEVVDPIRDRSHVDVLAFVDLLSGLSQRAGDVSGDLQEVRKRS
ncbi:hypothetical protein [Streptomyces collinus]|uniref:hypothetical protein n=1 Tax=Streptomyces collinus TaxID=42684 RepID=UPI0036CFCFA8